MSARIAVLSDVHGNVIALEAVRKAIRKEKPDVVLVDGDHALNGHDPAGVRRVVFPLSHETLGRIDGREHNRCPDAGTRRASRATHARRWTTDGGTSPGD